MVLVGLLSQLKWRDSRWSKQRRSFLVTRSHSQSNEWWLGRSTSLMPRIIGNSSRRISTTSSTEVTYELLVSYKLLRYHGVRSRIFRRELIRGPSPVSHTRRLSYKRSHPRPRLMETHPSVAGIKHYQKSRRPYAARTCLSSFFESYFV